MTEHKKEKTVEKNSGTAERAFPQIEKPKLNDEIVDDEHDDENSDERQNG